MYDKQMILLRWERENKKINNTPSLTNPCLKKYTAFTSEIKNDFIENIWQYAFGNTLHEERESFEPWLCDRKNIKIKYVNIQDFPSSQSPCYSIMNIFM